MTTTHGISQGSLHIPAKRAVIYARYSCSGQNEQSIEGQLRDNYSFAAREGIQVIGEYIDRAITGRTDDRPQFQQMVDDSGSKEFDYVIVWKLDRFARNRYDSAIYKHKLKANGVRVLSATENIGDNPESVILEAVLEASAEYYSIDLRQKTLRGMRESVLKGQSTGGTIALGYKTVDKRYVIDEDKAPIVRYVFEQYSNGVSKKDIVSALNAKGYTNRHGKPFTYNSLTRVLVNPKYYGTFKYDDMEREDTIPPIISKKLFDKVQIKLQAKRRAPAAKRAKIEYLLSGKLYCGLCGASMIGTSGTGKSGTVYSYYSCYNRNNKSACKKANEKKDFLEWYVVEQTLKYVLQAERMAFISKRVVEEYNREFNDGNLKSLERRISKINRTIDKCIESILESDIRTIRARLEEKIKELEMQKDDLSIDLSKLRIANKIRYTEKDILSWLKMFCNGDLMDEEFRRRIIDVFINSAYLYDDKIVIFYNIKDGKQISYIEACEAIENVNKNKKANYRKGVRISNTMVTHRRLELRTP